MACRQCNSALPCRGVIVGVRDDPLDAYADELARFYPNGVPVSEAGVALEIMRSRKLYEAHAEYQLPAAHVPAAPPEPQMLPVPPPAAYLPQIQSIAVNAWPMSEHGRVDSDGVIVEIQAVDNSGRPVAIQGTASIELFGQSQKLVRVYGDQFFGEAGKVKMLDRWTKTVDSARTQFGTRPIGSGSWAVGSGGVRITLPYSQSDPENDMRIYPVAALHVRLAVPGQGVFEATRSNLVLRESSRIRDRTMLDTGNRFLPQETTFGRRRYSGLTYRSTSALRPNGRVLTVQP